MSKSGQKLVIGCAACAAVGIYSYVFFKTDPQPSAAFFAPLPMTPTPGEPRSWEGGMGVGTYTTVNLRTGNLLTEIPLVGWTGRGPDISMNLYHNAALVGWKLNSRGTGWKLGAGWTTSYSSQLILTPATNPTSILAVADDGTQDTFTKVGSTWNAPTGIYDVLTPDQSNWRLTHKDQSYHKFGPTGLLLEIVDASGNAVTITRDAQSRIARVTDAAGRYLEFTAATNGYLQSMLDPKESGETTITDRTFTFSYTNSQLTALVDAMNFDIRISYNAAARISAIEDKDGDSFLYTYDSNGCLDIVTDPESVVNPLNPRLTQDFTFTVPTTTTSHTEYHDRRNSLWQYDYSNGALDFTTNPLSMVRQYTFDALLNLRLYTDPLNKTWEAAYDARGNMLTVTDPLSNVRQWEYDLLNNLTEYTDGEGNIVTLDYDDANNPTSPTLITEPPDGQGSAAAVTLLEYYNSDDISWNGLLKEVTDPNGVKSGFEYDQWGQQHVYWEGLMPTCEGTAGVGDRVWLNTTSADSGSRVYANTSPGSSGSQIHDSHDNRINSSCMPIGSLPDPEPPTGFPTLCSGLETPLSSANFSATYSPMSTPLTMALSLFLNGSNMPKLRDVTTQVDEFGLPLSHSVATDEDGSFTRSFTYTRDLAAGTATRTGPDGVETFVQYDAANRVQSLRRGPVVSPIMTASYTYYNDDRLESVRYSNDTSIVYRYDDGGRLTEIKHLNRIGDVMIKLNYIYDDRDLPTRLTHSDNVGLVAHTDFVYDTRGRLLTERGGGPNSYQFDYTYDLGGNRLTKIGDGKRTDYHYDIEDPCFYGSNNNRLEKYEDWNTVPDPDELVSETWYYYNAAGNVKRVVTEGASNPGTYSGTRLGYAENEMALTFAIGETWTGDSCPMQNHQVQYVREFRYDGARQRYLNIEHDPVAYQNGQGYVPLTQTWTDYDGNEVYGDYTFTTFGNPSTLVNLRSFQPGIAFNDPWSSSGSTNTKYYHQDMIGTTRDLSGSGGTSTSPSLYSAFGEHIAGALPTDATRYGYAGAWGYQEHDDFPFLHVGARYYDPSTGRFMQRDPAGIRGSMNVYAYGDAHPTAVIDPDGHGCIAADRRSKEVNEELLKWLKDHEEPKDDDDELVITVKPPQPFDVVEVSGTTSRWWKHFWQFTAFSCALHGYLIEYWERDKSEKPRDPDPNDPYGPGGYPRR